MNARSVMLFCLVMSCALHAQRDGAAVPSLTSADGAISGQIVAAASSPAVPVARAVVTLSGGGLERGTVADDDGRFTFVGLPPGRYAIGARKTAWLETTYGAIRTGGAGTPVALAAGERRNIAITMTRGSVVEGRLTMPNGAPATRTSVRAMPASGGPLPRGVAAAITDDRGLYRIYGLPPGDYVIQASPPVIPAMMQALPRPSTQDVDAALGQLRSRSAAVQPGTVRAPAPPVPVAARQTMYAPIFYPGVAMREHATTVTIAAGDERVGLDFVFAATPMSRVAGRVAGPVSSFAGVQIRLQARSGPASANATASVDGTFAVAAVAPGTYDAIARLDPHRRIPGPNEPQVTRVGSGIAADGSSPDTLWARGEVVVSGQDIDGVHLALVPGSTMSGRLRFIEDRRGPPPIGVSLRLTPVGGARQAPVVMPGSFTTVRQVDVGPDGRFEIAGLAPERYQLSATLPSSLTAEGWWARSAVVGGVDLLDVNVEMTPGTDIRDVDVLLSQRRSSLTGRLRLADGRPGSEYFVIAFSTDPRAWRVDSRRTHATRPADDGVFLLEDVPPGDYFLAVLWDFDAAMLQTSDFFEQATAVAVRFTLAEGEAREQSFEIGR